MKNKELSEFVHEFILVSCRGDHKELNKIIETLVYDFDFIDMGSVLSGLAGAIHQMNLNNIRGHLQN